MTENNKSQKVEKEIRALQAYLDKKAQELIKKKNTTKAMSHKTI